MVSDHGEESLTERLDAISGQRVSVVAHHDPTDTSNAGGPGGGSCMYHNTQCPVGHEERPKWLYQFKSAGPLQRAPGGYQVGSRLLELEKLNGHRVQVVLAVVPSVEELTKDPSSIGDLKEKLGTLQSLLRQVNDGKNGL